MRLRGAANISGLGPDDPGSNPGSPTFIVLLRETHVLTFSLNETGTEMKLMTDVDYVEMYARRLKNDNSIFAQQKKLIESQLQGSSSLFSKAFSGGDFRKAARKYLTGVGLL